MTIKELREEAKRLGIIGVFNLNKKELEDRIALLHRWRIFDC